jgi:ABC-type nitrate/sulfonate/bicarbonate transport system substrate-binding protein
MRRPLTFLGGILVVFTLACQPTPAPNPGASAPAASQPAAPAAVAPMPVKKLTLAIVSPNEAFSLAWVGRDSGIFLKHGFDVEVPVVTGSPRLVQSLIAGDFEYAMMGATALLRARMQGADPLILATTSNIANHNVMIRPESGVQRLSDLKGRLVGISQVGSEADMFLQIALSQAGLKAEDVSVIQTGGSPQTFAAMLSGNLDVGVYAGATVLRAHQAGIATLAGARELNVLSVSGILATTRRYVERDRDSVLRFMRAWVETVHYFKTQREETIRILQANLSGLELDEITFLYQDVADLLQLPPVPSDAAIQAMLDREDDAAARTHKPSDFVDLTFLHEIEQSGFLATLGR